MAIRTKIKPAATGATNKNITDTATLLAEIAAASAGDTIQLGSLDAGGQPASWMLGGVAVDNSTGKMLSTGGTPFLAEKLISPAQLAITQVFIEKNLTFKGDTNPDGSPKTVITGFEYDHTYVDANVACSWFVCNPLGKVVFQDLKFYETNGGPQVLTPTDMTNVVFDKCGQPVWVSLDPRAVYPNFATATMGGDMLRNVPDWAWRNPIKSLVKDCIFSNSYGWHMIGANELTIDECVFGPFKVGVGDLNNLGPGIGLMLNAITMNRMGFPLTNAERLTAWGRNVEISGCTFTNEGVDAGSMLAILDLTRNARGGMYENIMIHDNAFVHMNLDPMGIYGGYYAGTALMLVNGFNVSWPGYLMKNVRIFDNTFSDVSNSEGIGVRNTRSALGIAPAEDIWITDNKFEHFGVGFLGYKQSAIYMEYADNTFIVKNDYVDSDIPNIDALDMVVFDDPNFTPPIFSFTAVYLNECSNGSRL
jgi:hypothetical protein